MMKFLSSVIFVKDIDASRHFYCDLLDQKVAMDHGLNVGFEAGFALWQAEHAQGIIFGTPVPDSSPLGRKNFEFYFETEDLDAAWQRLSGAPVVHPLIEQPWGQRTFRVYDPDGHIVEVAEPMGVSIKRMVVKGLTLEEVAKQTAMPLDVVTYLSTN